MGDEIPALYLDSATAALAHLAAYHRSFLQRCAPEVVAYADRLPQPVRVEAVSADVAALACGEAPSSPISAPLAVAPPRPEVSSDVETLLTHIRRQLGDEATEAGLEAVRHS